MSELSQKICAPCRGGAPLLTGAEADALAARIVGWSVLDGRRIEKAFRFPNFQRALDFVNIVGAIAEEQDHHPDVYLAWGTVRLVIWTQKSGGLTESDFILAAKIDASEMKPAAQQAFARNSGSPDV